MNPEQKKSLTEKQNIDKHDLIITIDGLTGSGKWALAQQLAEHYDLTFINTGVSIRALALLAIENNVVKTDDTNAIDIPTDFPERVIDMYDRMPQKLTIQPPLQGSRDARFMVGDRNMLVALDAYEKRKAIENLSSIIAATPEIRSRLYTQWRQAVAASDGVVVVGRKTGEDLFPDAALKIFLHADPDVSAAYRFSRGVMASSAVSAESLYVKRRDHKDSASGLNIPPSDALVIDTSRYLQDYAGPHKLASLVTAHFDAKYTVRK